MWAATALGSSSPSREPPAEEPLASSDAAAGLSGHGGAILDITDDVWD